MQLRRRKWSNLLHESQWVVNGAIQQTTTRRALGPGTTSPHRFSNPAVSGPQVERLGTFLSVGGTPSIRAASG